MSKNTIKVLVGIGVGIPLLIALGFAGVYLGGIVFAVLQKIPQDAVSLTTLRDYWQAYSHIKLVKASLVAGGGVAAAVPLLPVAMLIYIAVGGDKRELHGSARFANTSEIRKAGLLDDESKHEWPGIVVGKYKGKFLIYYGQNFIALRSRTRGGKDVGIVNPNYLYYPHSIVGLDIKLENWEKTSGFRAENGHECYLFAPNHKDKTSHRWNPLSYIRRQYEYRIGDIQSIATMLYPNGGKDAFWNDNAQILFLGLLLYLLETPSEAVTFANLLRLTTPSNGMSLNSWIEATIIERESDDSTDPRLSVECVDAMRSFSVNTDQVRANILSTLQAPLKIFRVPQIAAATSGDDFDLRDVRKKKMTIYLGMTSADLNDYDLLAKLFMSQLLNENTKVLPSDDPALKYQCMLMFNEFASLGRIKIIQKSIAYMAAYNMRLVLIFQNKGQIADRDLAYGPEGADTLMTNCAMNIMFEPKELPDAKEYSEKLGYLTVKQKSKTRQLSGKTGRSENESDQRRALMMPQELMEMGFHKVIISMEGMKPILADKIIYWSDPAFEGRISLPPPVVPVLEIVRTEHRLRVLSADEVAAIDVDEIANQAEFLKVMGDAIGFDFSAIEAAVDEVENDIALAA